MASPAGTERRDLRGGGLLALAGAGLIAVAFACSGGSAAEESEPAAAGAQAPAPDADGESMADDVGAAPDAASDAAADAGPVAGDPDLGTSFSDPVEVPDGDAPRGPGLSPSMESFAAGVDPSRLTPEALAANPLVIGVEEREPFVLAEGADPLDPNSYDWEKDDDGYWIISYYDLSLDGIDSEALLDALVYPEEYEDEDLVFPDRIRALHGQKVALTGYMIAAAWKKDRVTNFMLVRDLLACCYGGSPEPDEWVDVHMEGRGSHSYQFVPVVTRGVFHLQGVADDAGYATGAFRIDGHDTREE